MRGVAGSVWVVRTGERARFVAEFEAGGHVAVGFREVAAEDLRDLDEAEVRRRGGDPRQRNGAAQLVAFAYRMDVDDLVVTPRLPMARDYLVGRLGAYEHDPQDPPSGPHRRRVRWLGTFPRSQLSPEATNTLGAIQTVFRPTAAEAEVRALMTRLDPLTDAPAEAAPQDRLTRGGPPAPAPAVAAATPTPPVASSVQVDVAVDQHGRAEILCRHPALVMEQVPRHLDPGPSWDGAPGVYVLTGTQLEHSTVRTGTERTLTATSIVRPWAYVGLSEAPAGSPATGPPSRSGAARCSCAAGRAHPATTSATWNWRSTARWRAPARWLSARAPRAATSPPGRAAPSCSTPVPRRWSPSFA